jgi:hypothetical protein
VSSRRELTAFFGAGALLVGYAASRPERRRLLGALELASAVDPDTAMSTFQLAAEQSRVMARLVRDGLVVPTPDGRFYIGDRRRIRISNRVSAAMGVGATLLCVAAIAGLLWLVSV